MKPACENHGCAHAQYCKNHIAQVPVTGESRKGIANSVARMVCTDWQLFSISSLLESDGKRLEASVHTEQTSKGFTACFRSPY
jgi:hypothetical protein